MIRGALADGRFDHANTGDASELASTLDVYGRTKTVVYSIRVDDLRAGDVLLATAEAEVTNDLGFNVGVFGQIVLADSPTTTSGTELTEANGFNISRNMHHGVTAKMGSVAAPRDLGTRYVNLVMWALSDAAVPGSKVEIERDYGRLTLMRF